MHVIVMIGLWVICWYVVKFMEMGHQIKINNELKVIIDNMHGLGRDIGALQFASMFLKMHIGMHTRNSKLSTTWFESHINCSVFLIFRIIISIFIISSFSSLLGLARWIQLFMQPSQRPVVISRSKRFFLIAFWFIEKWLKIIAVWRHSNCAQQAIAKLNQWKIWFLIYLFRMLHGTDYLLR